MLTEKSNSRKTKRRKKEEGRSSRIEWCPPWARPHVVDVVAVLVVHVVRFVAHVDVVHDGGVGGV